MERENPLEEARRRLRESTERLEQARNNKEAFEVNLQLAGQDSEAAVDAYMSGDTKEAWIAVEKHLRDVADCVSEALELAPTCTSPGQEKALEELRGKISNVRISAWEWHKSMEEYFKRIDRPTGKPVCPSILYYTGIDDMLKNPVRASEFCLNECPYQAQCDAKIAPSAP